MWGASDEELNELAVVVANTAFWSNILLRIMITTLLLKN